MLLPLILVITLQSVLGKPDSRTLPYKEHEQELEHELNFRGHPDIHLSLYPSSQIPCRVSRAFSPFRMSHLYHGTSFSYPHITLAVAPAGQTTSPDSPDSLPISQSKIWPVPALVRFSPVILLLILCLKVRSCSSYCVLKLFLTSPIQFHLEPFS